MASRSVSSFRRRNRVRGDSVPSPNRTRVSCGSSGGAGLNPPPELSPRSNSGVGSTCKLPVAPEASPDPPAARTRAPPPDPCARHLGTIPASSVAPRYWPAAEPITICWRSKMSRLSTSFRRRRQLAVERQRQIVHARADRDQLLFAGLEHVLRGTARFQRQPKFAVIEFGPSRQL